MTCASANLRFYLSAEAKTAGIELHAPRSGDAGFDLRSLEDMVLPPGEQIVVPTGLKIAVPPGWVGIVKDRSSMALKRIYSHAGVIDASYRGEVRIVLSNAGSGSYHIERGAKIAQLVVVPHMSGCEEVSSEAELGDTARGAGGFGSTGK